MANERVFLLTFLEGGENNAHITHMWGEGHSRVGVTHV